MLHPVIFNTSQVCAELGVKHAVLSPGSRNAPLLLSFARHEGIEKKIVPDERTAGFIALGIAQATRTPVVLACTSGTAMLNYAPAVAEAFYREIPLIVLSADRPPALIDQRDGQTIRQHGALKNHVKKSYSLPLIQSAEDDQAYEALLIEGLTHSQQLPMGPVHLNIPFEEPFYPSESQKLTFKKTSTKKIVSAISKSKPVSIPEGKKVLLLFGQMDANTKLIEIIKPFSSKIPVIRSPLNNLSFGICHVDGFVKDQQALAPDVLITAGLSVLSKNLKTFLRNHKPANHYHIDPAGVEVDTYGSAPIMIQQPLEDFFHTLEIETNPGYLQSWRQLEAQTAKAMAHCLSDLPFSETVASHFILKSMPHASVLHLGNSMPVRFADLFGVPSGVRVFANRGTSGIDGCTSTAIGSSSVDDAMHFLLTGDLGFLYDRNAFLIPYIPHNLRVIVMNNRGGGIFRLIKGPSALPELEDYFETRHDRTARYICEENKLTYHTASDLQTLQMKWKDFIAPSDTAKILEVFTDPNTNQKAYKTLRNSINEQTGD